jgi:hypothetical protein
MARVLLKHKIKFHFIGNQAVNFKDYWETIMKHKPNNCIVWGERNDVDLFVQSCDVHLFTSNLELNPISIKESLEYEKPTMIFNLPTYMGKYNQTNNIHFLTGNLIEDCTKLLKLLKINQNKPKNNISNQTNYEFMTQYITSFGDVVPKFNVDIEWNHVDGFYLNLTSDSDEVFDVERPAKELSEAFQVEVQVRFGGVGRTTPAGFRVGGSTHGEQPPPRPPDEGGRTLSHATNDL